MGVPTTHTRTHTHTRTQLHTHSHHERARVVTLMLGSRRGVAAQGLQGGGGRSSRCTGAVADWRRERACIVRRLCADCAQRAGMHGAESGHALCKLCLAGVLQNAFTPAPTWASAAMPWRHMALSARLSLLRTSPQPAMIGHDTQLPSHHLQDLLPQHWPHQCGHPQLDAQPHVHRVHLPTCELMRVVCPSPPDPDPP